MVILPPGFVPTKYPGYYWDTNTKSVFSLKCGYELREMQRRLPNRWSQLDGWRISHLGRKRSLFYKDLVLLKSDLVHIIPVVRRVPK